MDSYTLGFYDSNHREGFCLWKVDGFLNKVNYARGFILQKIPEFRLSEGPIEIDSLSLLKCLKAREVGLVKKLENERKN
jgi:hypothetical protein